MSDKTTGLLCVRLSEISDAISLAPLENSRNKIVRSAYISMGYLLRKAICNHLDIDLDELNVDYRIVEDQESNKRVGKIFFSDSLENGADFCNYVYSNRHLVRKELLEVFTAANSSSKFHKIFKDHNCFLSCYDCVKDYSNQFYHDYLNWRLGLDMIHLALDSKNFPCFTTPHWKKFMETHFGNCNPAKPIIVKDKKLFVVHPLWSEAYIDKIKEDNALGDYTPISVLEAECVIYVKTNNVREAQNKIDYIGETRAKCHLIVFTLTEN
ncbi:MAG: hypothetical protein IJV93_04990 [Lentisphaeria bacterium]|nr:hypothetical protein [Lentisphaeria bacterium]